MPEVVIHELGSRDDPRPREDLLPLLRQLRPGLTGESFEELVTDGYDQGLRYLLAYAPAGAPLGAAGYRIMPTSRGRILFVDDLVTDAAARGTGVGALLMAELARRAGAHGCVRVELDSGVANTGAHRFYLDRRMAIVAFHFAASCPGDDR